VSVVERPVDVPLVVAIAAYRSERGEGPSFGRMAAALGCSRYRAVDRLRAARLRSGVAWTSESGSLDVQAWAVRRALAQIRERRRS
jgi:hypothetical protein